MGREFSIYLDFMRFFAAFLVVLHHINNPAFLIEKMPLSGYGHSAVMLFFVLSGYVIAHVTSTRERDFKSYAANRCGRIYSVALPAMLLTPFLDQIGYSLLPEMYQGRAPYDLWGIRMISSLIFTNELWFMSIMSFSNLPYWSLNYEVWYYVLFAAIIFLDGKKRIFYVSLIMLIVGPKIMLLAPLWWLGVWLYSSVRLGRTSEAAGWLLLLLSIFLMYLFISLDIEAVCRNFVREQIGLYWSKQLVSSQFFISHYILGMIIAIHFVGIRAVSHQLSWIFLPLERPIRFFANYTFTTYLFHMPLILFFGALYNGDPSGWSYVLSILFSVLVSVFIIGQFTENRKQLFRDFFVRLFDRVEVVYTRLRAAN